MTNVQIRDMKLECQVCGEITTITVTQQAAIVAELKRQGVAARKTIDCKGACHGKTQWSLARGEIG